MYTVISLKLKLIHSPFIFRRKFTLQLTCWQSLATYFCISLANSLIGFPLFYLLPVSYLHSKYFLALHFSSFLLCQLDKIFPPHGSLHSCIDIPIVFVQLLCLWKTMNTSFFILSLFVSLQFLLRVAFQYLPTYVLFLCYRSGSINTWL